MLNFTALAELSTRQIAETAAAVGLPANKRAAKTGGGIAHRARLELESKTGRNVVTGENYLPPSQKRASRLERGLRPFGKLRAGCPAELPGLKERDLGHSGHLSQTR